MVPPTALTETTTVYFYFCPLLKALTGRISLPFVVRFAAHCPRQAQLYSRPATDNSEPPYDSLSAKNEEEKITICDSSP